MKERINLDTNLKHYSYPSIEQFRNVIHQVNYKTRCIGREENGELIYDNTIPLPNNVKFLATSKIHGTNASIVFDFKNHVIYYQSRENIITPAKDNAGFANAMAKIQTELFELIETIDYNFSGHDIIVVFGEWCGKGIQKNVAVSEVDKMFVIFDIKLIDSKDEQKEEGEQSNTYWLNKDLLKDIKLPQHKIFNIFDYKTWEFEIDFNNPEASQEELNKIVLEVENECPVGLAFGKTGTGEGIVLKSITPGFNGSRFWMKCKGEKHSNRKQNSPVETKTETLKDTSELVDKFVTENRCKQSISKLKEQGKFLDRKVLGEFIKWIVDDIVKEEIDVILQSGFVVKELSGPISVKARTWFFNNELNLSDL